MQTKEHAYISYFLLYVTLFSGSYLSVFVNCTPAHSGGLSKFQMAAAEISGSFLFRQGIQKLQAGVFHAFMTDLKLSPYKYSRSLCENCGISKDDYCFGFF